MQTSRGDVQYHVCSVLTQQKYKCNQVTSRISLKLDVKQPMVKIESIAIAVLYAKKAPCSPVSNSKRLCRTSSILLRITHSL